MKEPCCCLVVSVVSDSVWPHRRQPTRLPHPWDSPGKNTGVGCHFLLQCMKMKSESEVAQSCPTLCNPMDCSPPGSSIHGIFQARVLEWGANVFLSPFLFLLSAWSTTPSMSLAQAVLPHQLWRNTPGIRAGCLSPPSANCSLLCCCCSVVSNNNSCSGVSESCDPKDCSPPGSKFYCSFRFFCNFKILYL